MLNFNQTHWQVINVYIISSYPQGVQPDHVVAPRHIHLQWPGDVIDLELLAFAFYHVNGTNVLYLYARPKGLGKCLMLRLFIECVIIQSYDQVQILHVFFEGKNI